MIDQSHNVEPKLEAMLQSVLNCQSAYAKALIVDRAALAERQAEHDVLGAYRVLTDAFETDVRPCWRKRASKWACRPIRWPAYNDSPYPGQVAAERGVAQGSGGGFPEPEAMTNAILDQLVALSNTLGKPENDFASSARATHRRAPTGETFYVKSSGSELRTITAAGFCHVVLRRVMRLLDVDGMDDQAVKAGLQASKVDPDAPGHPSVETLLHGLCLSLPGVNFVGHTPPDGHQRSDLFGGLRRGFSRPVVPDEIVLCGPATVLVPYTDPGSRSRAGERADRRLH